jgi:hypothetical protein
MGQLKERRTPRAELLHVLMLPDFDRVRQIQLFYGNPKTRTFGELLIDLEESPHARGVVLGELRGAGAAPAGLDKARLRMLRGVFAVGRIADGSDRYADAIVGPSRLRGSNEQNHNRRASDHHQVMSNDFLAGILVGLLIGGSTGTLAIALVAVGSKRRSYRAQEARLPTE